MSLLMHTFTSTASQEEAEVFFKIQTFSLFSEDDISLEIENDRFESLEGQIFAVADLDIQIKRDRMVIIDSVQKKLISSFIKPRLTGDIGKKATEQEQDFYTDMTTRNIAEQIVTATLGANFLAGERVARKGSFLPIHADEDGSYTTVIGKKVYAKGDIIKPNR